jgi:hypothetical protein
MVRFDAEAVAVDEELLIENLRGHGAGNHEHCLLHDSTLLSELVF